MSTSYSDLSTYWSCPRLFGFKKLGYIPPTVSEPLATGSLTHIGIAAHFRGQDAQQAMSDTLQENYSAGISKLSGAERYEYEETLSKASARARELLKRYVAHWAKDYQPILVEPELELDRVICHPDLIAHYKERRAVVDHKTSYHPDNRWYDLSGQVDLYAYILRATESADLVIYDVISEEGIFRHMRPPRLEAGRRLFEGCQELNNKCSWESKADEGFHLKTYFLNEPHPDYTCPSRCSFFVPCWLLETDTWESCRDYLESNFLWEGK